MPLSHVIKVGVVGAGRMGRAVIREVAAHDAYAIAKVWVRGAGDDARLDTSAPQSADLEQVIARADVVIDFSLPEATVLVADTAARLLKPLVCGVSALGDAQRQALARAAAAIAVVHDRNMSQGITLLRRLVAQAAATLGEEYAVTIRDTHHVHKKDAPSGTALALGAAIEPLHTVHYESQRHGEAPGEHDVEFASAVETITLSHRVATRQVFAAGALRAAAWALQRPPGMYDMSDVLA